MTPHQTHGPYRFNLLRLAVCSAALSVTAMAWAQSSTTPVVKVGKFTKRSLGTVVDMTAGDIACYLTLKDEQGAEFTEMAEFGLCDQPRVYLGRRVALAYVLGTVMSDACQGDPNCKKTQTVALVSSLKVLAPVPAARTGNPPPTTTAPVSFCTDKETVVFACRTGAKLVSVCAPRHTPPAQGHLQYRFGKPETPDALELTLPEGELTAAKAATGGSVPFAGGGGSWLRFKKGAYGYVVYTGIGKWGPRGSPQEKSGLVVERSGKAVAHLKCTNGTQSELGHDWFERFGVRTPSDEDFLFPD